jgi:tetratricopeptide (TPR) repeat protein
MTTKLSSFRWPRGVRSSLAGLVLATAGCQTPESRKPTPRESWDRQRAALKHELSQTELQSGRAREAVRLAGEAVALSPENPAHAELLARAYVAKGDFATARQAIEVALRVHPDAVELTYLLGATYEHEQKWPEAIAAYQAAARQKPETLEYLVALAEAQAQSGDADAALQTLAAQEPRFGADAAYHATFAELAQQAGRLEDACTAYEKALRLGAAGPQLREALALCQARLGRFDRAVQNLDLVIRGGGKLSLATAATYAGALLSLGRSQKAVDWLTRDALPRLGNDSDKLWLLLARAQSETGATAAALDAAQRATQVAPESDEAFTVLAGLLLAAGRDADARAAVERALRLNPEQPDAWLVLGRCEERRRDRAAAQAAYERALELEPANRTAAALLAQLAGPRN